MSYPAETPDEVQREYGEWASGTWPHQTPASVVAHLREEVEELGEAHRAEEAADCLLLLLNHAHQCGYSLWGEAVRKMAVNKARRWGPPNAEGISHHEQGAQG